MRTINIDFGKNRVNLNISTTDAKKYDLKTIEEAEKYYKDNKNRMDKEIDNMITRDSLIMGHSVKVESHKFNLTSVNADSADLMYMQ